MNIIVKKMLDGTYNVGVRYEKKVRTIATGKTEADLNDCWIGVNRHTDVNIYKSDIDGKYMFVQYDVDNYGTTITRSVRNGSYAIMEEEMDKVQYIQERKLLSVARQRKGYTAIKRGIAQLLASEGSSFDEVRKVILEQKGKLSIRVCEDWARGLGWETLGFKQSLLFATEEIFDFLVKTLVGKTDEVNEDRIYVYGKATYSYDLNQVDEYYWRCVGMILWSAR